ncbi:cytochrome P450 [Pseudenhygromyxa sp. WMMC2535]|uniref:cytochrome P450 n=1 Tax=Pseudenhygromyxa sp. WMMC2535 TaxID=2712867 RepID=UPI00155467EE|nr:cytochrome P450 [Pseudenhygromyxa sp. WMMC2535]NVB40984.1 cytochrome P450 [Pseudenhygromyxa sp. WMMC2535]
MDTPSTETPSFATGLAEVPAHVPSERVVDFDYLRPPGIEDDLHRAWKSIQDSAPDIFWTPRNGGHWVVTRAEDIKAIQLDHEGFSHRRMVVQMPDADPMGNLISMDPPQHTPFRTLISPALSLRAVKGLELGIRETMIGIIDALLPRGGCEFVGDFAKVLPVVIFLRFVELPEADRPRLLELAEEMIRPTSMQAQFEAHAAIIAYLGGHLRERAQAPGKDLLSKIVHAEIDGRPITMEEAEGLSNVVLAGGLDTVASMLGFVARFLALNPEHRHKLIAEPALIPNAVEELIRRHGLVNTARLITRDMEFGGLCFKAGEQVLVPNHLYGLDERQVGDPLAVDFERERPAAHYAAFGNGPHRCPGSYLAKAELKIFLEEWLRRIPEFEIAPDTKPVFACGPVNTVRELQLRWGNADAQSF